MMKKIHARFNVLMRFIFALAFFCSLVGAQRSVAQQGVQSTQNFPYAPSPPAPNGATIAPPDYQADEPTYSMGVCQIVVDSANAGLFNPVSMTILGYPGYSPSSYTLTSPVLYDSTTEIGTSQLEGYVTGGGGVTQTIPSQYTSGVIVGGPDITTPWNTIGVGAYSAIPPGFSGGFPPPAIGSLVVNTEIEMFDLVCYDLQCVSNDSRTPPPPPTPIDMVAAGPNAGLVSMGNPPGLFGGAFTDIRQRSLGMVQQDSTAPGTTAESFFNINVQVNLPAISSTASASDFPAVPGYTGTPPGLLRLTNNWINGPLVITNTNVTSLPPQVVYIHGQTPAVDLYFMDNGPTWHAGDHFGFITLAGHGVITNGTNGCAPGTNSSGQAGPFTQSTLNTVLDTVLGPIGSPKTPMPIMYTRSSPLFPTPGTTWNSLVNTAISGTGSNVLDAQVSYAGGAITVSDLVLGILSNNVSLPPASNNVVFYTEAGVPISFLLGVSGSSYPASGTVSLTVAVTNKGMSSTLTYPGGPPPITNFSLGIMSLSGNANWQGGPIYLRQDPASASLGQRAFEAAGSSYKVSTSINAMLEVSSDNVTWLTESGPLVLQDSAVPPGPRPISTSIQGTTAVLSWQGGATLQGSTNLSMHNGGWTDLTTSNTLSPFSVTLITNVPVQFFRLKFP